MSNPPSREAGPTLDAEIARLMGIEIFNAADDGVPPVWIEEHTGRNVAEYSTSIAAAFEVVEKLRESQPLFFELRGGGSIASVGEHVTKPYQDYYARFVSTVRPASFSQADSPALAICLAALNAISGALPQ